MLGTREGWAQSWVRHLMSLRGSPRGVWKAGDQVQWGKQQVPAPPGLCGEAGTGGTSSLADFQQNTDVFECCVNTRG